MIAYLSGGMENAVGEGAVWREDITKWLYDNLGHTVVNPVKESQKIIEKTQSFGFREWKKSDPERFVALVRQLIDRDIETLVNKADYVICLWDNSVLKGGGTHGEVTLAYHYGIPVYLVNKLPADDLSGWIQSCSTEVVDGFDALKKSLLKTFRKNNLSV